ncbi:facilitated trehalose transporter Tret1-like isoform X2 [Daktulosphaira vitifoliae]|nr:facilitated trehalose transporter Tret1-like isoform X2 [Daktulosphaira vitifoliae]
MNHVDKERNNNVKSTISQCVAILGACFLQVGIGTEMMSPTIIIGTLVNNTVTDIHDPMYLTMEQASWFGSLLYLCTPLGSILSSLSLSRLGHKKCMLLTNIPYLAALVMFYYSRNIATLYACSIIMGLSMGYAGGPSTSYITEVCEPKLRGSLTSAQNVFFYLGSLLTSAIYAYTKDWRLTLILTSVIPIINTALLLMTPDSPVWLLTRDKSEKARRMLRKLRGWAPRENCESEFQEMIVYTSVDYDDKDDNDNQTISTWKLLKQPNVLRPFRLLIFYFIFANTLSSVQYNPYLVQVLTKFGAPVNIEWTITFSVMLSISGGILTIFTVHISGKRLLTLVTLMVSSLCYILVGSIGMFNPMMEPTKSWIVMILFLISIFSASYGIVPLGWVLLGELFPLQTRHITCSTCASLSYLITFVLTKFYPDFESAVGFYNGFIIFGTTGLLGCVYFYMYLPETENKTLQEIEESFK